MNWKMTGRAQGIGIDTDVRLAIMAHVCPLSKDDQHLQTACSNAHLDDNLIRRPVAASCDSIPFRFLDWLAGASIQKTAKTDAHALRS